MILAVVLTGLLVILTVLTVTFYLLVQYRKARAEFIGSIQSFFTAPDEKTPSPLATVVEQISMVFARHIVGVAKTSFMGIQSGESRAEKGIEGDIAMDLLGQTNPVVAGLLKSFPALAKRIRKNPDILPLAMAGLQKLMGKGVRGDNGGGTKYQGEFVLGGK